MGVQNPTESRAANSTRKLQILEASDLPSSEASGFLGPLKFCWCYCTRAIQFGVAARPAVSPLHRQRQHLLHVDFVDVFGHAEVRSENIGDVGRHGYTMSTCFGLDAL